jgi:hypothetical protein
MDTMVIAPAGVRNSGRLIVSAFMANLVYHSSLRQISTVLLVEGALETIPGMLGRRELCYNRGC